MTGVQTCALPISKYRKQVLGKIEGVKQMAYGACGGGANAAQRIQTAVEWSEQQQNQSRPVASDGMRSEEHTSELQSHVNLVCRLLLEKKKKYTITNTFYYVHKLIHAELKVTIDYAVTHFLAYAMHADAC